MLRVHSRAGPMADKTSEQLEQHSNLDKAPYRLSVDAAVAGLGSDIESGLSGAEAEQRRQRYGGNVLRENGRRPFRRLVLHQFRDPLIIILCVAAALASVSYTHLTLPTMRLRCRSRWTPYH